jgi:uroporphyrinogen decarboxylase
MTIDHRLPDRTPTTIFARAEVQRALVERFRVSSFDDVLRRIGAELYADVELSIRFPGFDARANDILRGDCPFAGQAFVFRDERTFEDGWGIVRRVGSDGKYVQWVSGPLEGATTAAELDAYPFPRPEWICGGDELEANVREARRRGLVSRCFVENPYKTAWYLHGMENILADYVTNPGFVEALYDRIWPFAADLLRRATRAGTDVIAIEGDIAMQDRIIMGPERWRAVDKPRLAAMLRACREINPGVYAFFHSDGNLTEVMEDLIEIGFQIIDSIQPECMDPAATKARFGQRCTLHGCGSLQRVLPFGTPEDCRAEVKKLIEQCGYDGGLVLRPSNMIGFDVPLDNIIAWYDAAMEYDLGKLPQGY